MAYCYECGEKVAENDVFCPYCGISLEQLSVGGGDDESDLFGKTIAVQQSSLISPATPAEIKSENTVESSTAQTPAAPLPEKSSAPSNQTSAHENLPKENDDDSWDAVFTPTPRPENAIQNHPSSAFESTPETSAKSQESENIDEPNAQNLKSNFDAPVGNSDIPTPKILETLNPFGNKPVNNDSWDADDVHPQVSSPLSEQSNTANDFSDFSSEKPENADEAAAAYDLQNESALMGYEEQEVKEVLSAEEPETSVDDSWDAPAVSNHKIENQPINQSNDFDINDFDVREDSTSGNFAAENKNFNQSNFNNNQSTGDAFSASVKAEQPIVMPEVDLPIVDSNPPSKFDSVSIMEKTEEKSDFSREIPKAAEESSAPKDASSMTSPIAANSDTGGKSKTKLKPLEEGTVLNGRYEIIRKIGGGGMGAVYLASDKNLGGVLRAVKEMVQSYIEDEQQVKAVNDFKRESLLLTSLDHQSIPTIYDYFFDEKEARFYLVMKYISGGDLAGRLRSAPEGRIDEKSVTQWAIQIADVLDYLHNRQPPIVYRDLKPANIMVDGNSGRVMLIDFGIARWVNKEEKGVTAVGTMGYAPPELFSGNVEARSDIYSLGSTMFHLLTGADPQSNPLLIFDFQKHPRPRQINPQLSDQMERILMRAVEYNADKRFGSAAEMRQSLEDHFESLKFGKATYGVKEVPAAMALSDQPVFCGFCGQKIVATDMFCAFCGAKQPLAQQGVHSENYSRTPLTAKLLIVGTNELEQPAFRLEKDTNLVGRRDPMSNIFPEVDLSKYDPQTKISRRHARIWREGNEYMVEDLGSSNGTYILPVTSNTMRLQPRQPQLLTNGDKIKLGDTTLHFILG